MALATAFSYAVVQALCCVGEAWCIEVECGLGCTGWVTNVRKRPDDEVLGRVDGLMDPEPLLGLEEGPCAGPLSGVALYGGPYEAVPLEPSSSVTAVCAKSTGIDPDHVLSVIGRLVG